MSDEEKWAHDPEVQRLMLLWEEGLLCRRCHSELSGLWEVEFGLCLDCVREENASHPLPDGPEPVWDGTPLPF